MALPFTKPWMWASLNLSYLLCVTFGQSGVRMLVQVYKTLTNRQLQSRYLTKHENNYHSFFSWFRMGERHMTFDSRVKMANGMDFGDLVSEGSEANPLCWILAIWEGECTVVRAVGQCISPGGSVNSNFSLSQECRACKAMQTCSVNCKVQGTCLLLLSHGPLSPSYKNLLD